MSYRKKSLGCIVSALLCLQMCPVAYAIDLGASAQSDDVLGVEGDSVNSSEESDLDGRVDSGDDVFPDDDSDADNPNAAHPDENHSESEHAVEQFSDDSEGAFVDASLFANSWRFQNGQPSNAASVFSRASGVTWIEENGVYYASDGTVVSGASAFGIDVSQWNGTINWSKVKSAGVDYVIIRCGFGGDDSSQDDSYFIRNVEGALNAGLDIGVYIYSYGWDAATGKSEAQHVLRLLKKAGLDPDDLAYPVYYDLEQESKKDGKPCGVDDSGVERPASNSALLSMTKAFASTIEAAGYEVGVYANLNWWNNYLTSSEYDKWDRWVAQYNYTCDYDGDYAMWQCMSDGKIDGISGYVDINFDFGLGYGMLDSLAEANKNLIADGVYTIASAKDSSKVLDVASGSVSNGGNVQLYTSNGTNAQQWRISHDEKGYVTLTNINSGKVLDVKSGKYANGTNVQQYSGNNTRAQKWIVIQNNDGTYSLFSALKTNVSLDVKSGIMSNGSNIQIYASNGTAAQSWTFNVQPDSRTQLDSLAAQNRDVLDDGGTYYIATALGSGSLQKATAVLDVASGSVSNYGNVQIYASNKTEAQQWKVLHDSQGYVTFINVKSGKALDVSGGKYTSGTNVQQYAPNDSYAQKWIVTKEADGYAIRSALWPNVLLDVSTGASSNSSNVQIKSVGSSVPARQTWTFLSIEDAESHLDQAALDNRDTIPDGVYVIKSALASTKVLDVASGSTANSANVQLYGSNMTAAQQWRVTHDSEGYVTFTNVKSGKVLDVSGGKFKNGTNVQQYTGNDSAAQKWVVKKDGNSYVIVSALWPDLVLDVKSGGTANKTNVQVYGANGTKAQTWQFLSVNPEVAPCDDLGLSGVYVIASSINSNYVFDVKSGSTANGANIQLYKRNNTSAQKFSFVYENGYYRIINLKSGKALDVDNGNVVPTTNLQQWTSSTTNENQLFSIRKNADGTFTFVNKASGLALGVSGGKVANGTNIQGYLENGTAAQFFTLVRM